MQDQIPELLRDLAEDMPHLDVPADLRPRARRRIALRVGTALVAAVALALGAFAGIQVLHASQPPVPIHRPTPPPAGSLPGTIAFTQVQSPNGPWHVYVAQADGTVSQLTHGQSRVIAEAWSPDGSQLIVADGTGLSLVRFDGSSEVHLSDAHSVPSFGGAHWSPDGTEIAFQAGRRIYVINADGTAQRKVADKTDPDSLARRDFSWSPDGRKIVFALGDSHPQRPPSKICVVNSDGAGLVCLSESSLMGAEHPAWSPDGTQIAFDAISTDPGLGEAIYVMDTDGSGLTRLRRGHSPVWSPDGSRIAYRIGRGVPAVMNRDGTGQIKLPGSSCSFSCGAISWSPDGSKLAVTDFNVGGVVIVNTDGSGSTKVAADLPGVSAAPIWRPIGPRGPGHPGG